MHRLRAGVVGLALVALAMTPTTALADDRPFHGRWVSTDTDGSSQVLIVSGGATPSVNYQDDVAHVCAEAGSPNVHWVAAGAGQVEDDVLVVAFHQSGCGSILHGGYVDWWQYDAASDTLGDAYGVTWYRAR